MTFNSLTPLKSGVHATGQKNLLVKLLTFHRSVVPGLRRDERRLRGFFVSLLTIIGLTTTACQNQDTTMEADVDAQTIYLVRHAEKTKEDNPGLTEAGKARAEALADRLEDKNITHIHSTKYRRTLATAQPLSERLGIEVALYDPRNLEGFSIDLKDIGSGNHLVVGHSNTTPELTSMLTWDDVEAMPETEYDRLLTVYLDEKGDTIKWTTERYGATK